jgi:hypothetical protein
MEKLKMEIRNKYNLKANIIGPMACAMAIQLELHEQVEVDRCKKLKRLPAEKEVEIQWALQESQDFKLHSMLLYDEQSKHGNCSPSTFLDMHMLNGHTGENATTSTLPQVATMSHSGPDHEDKHVEGEVAGTTHSGTHHKDEHEEAGEMSRMTKSGTDHKEELEETGENRLGLKQPHLQAMGEEITGANKNKLSAEN